MRNSKKFFGTKLEREQAKEIVEAVLKDPKIRRSEQELPSQNKEEWVYLSHTKIWEHTEWMNVIKVQEIFQEILNKSTVKVSDLQIRKIKDRAKMILSAGGPFVAMVDDYGSFSMHLIDHQLYSEKVARALIE